ncbi:MAG TPA: ATP-binding protein [Solirubrobacteraceae bacterium]|nr:ATP-binding protein [Solirubrobacteraceae bacterium]
MPAAETRARAVSLASRLATGQLLALVSALPLIVVLAAVTIGIIELTHQASVRSELVNRIEPANLAASELATAVVDEETGVRGYELSAESQFLQPFTEGSKAAAAALGELQRYRIEGSQAALALLSARIEEWRSQVALPAIARVRPGRPSITATVDALYAKQLFDGIRRALALLQQRISDRLTVVKTRLSSAADATSASLGVIAGLLVLAVLGTAVALRRTVTRPLERLAASARRVAEGDLDYELRVTGPREVIELRDDVESMRVRLAAELAAAERARDQIELTAAELSRSNAELEQFAYVASHDLREPLRKVTSFCQLLQERYAGQLDERADQYIEYAVDGATRMQELISDLLAFSRVGRIGERRARVELRSLVDAATADLANSLQDAGGKVEVGELPAVTVEVPVMRTVFQNLISNSIKFRSSEPLRIQIKSERREREWLISVDDNGIGIEPQYAERVFVIFQRLHSRSEYEGTGIGLAMSRKVIEHHGGRIWLDPDHAPGIRVCFTLPLDDADL